MILFYYQILLKIYKKEWVVLLITREVDYALRILRTLSIHKGELISTTQICSQAVVPQQFAYKIIKKLQNAGMISIARGAEGGCTLTMDMDKTSLFDLIQAINGGAVINACIDQDYSCSWIEKNGEICNIHMGLDKVRHNINKELKSHSIKSLLTGADK